ncbi:MAG TPA: phosphatidylglycerol lysyltransferase domain-containing protein [Acidimicrobiales bacterium]|nr:phosphatidylglycerol lysyltransferase domain-containing protein [Acidimicrobiales bacterium]
MAANDRLTLPIPFGQHVYVVSDLSLSPMTPVTRRSLREFIELLRDVDDQAVVIVAGNLFHPDPTADMAKFVSATLAAQPSLVAVIQRFLSVPGRRVVVIPGSDDGELAEHDGAQRALEAIGIEVARDVMLQVATANGTRDLAVAAGSYELDVTRADTDDRADADRLEDPNALARFVASRVLYRRLAPWLWLPLGVVAVVNFWSSLVAVVGHVLHHHFEVEVFRVRGFWASLLLNLIIIGAVEATIAAIAGLIVRRRFKRESHSSLVAELSEPLAVTSVDEVDGIEYARRVAERGGAGAVIGGAPRPALAFLDRGVCATPGPSRTVIVERRGRFGLPPIFAAVDRIGVVEIEASSTVQVRLYAGETRRPFRHFIEWLLAGTPMQPAPTPHTSTVGSWPTGNPFPLEVARLQEQRRRRTVRRLASGLIFLDGLLNVTVTAIKPLRSHLHTVLSILPLGAIQSAAALTAVAGIALIMLARGIRRGQRRAWFLAVALLAITIVAHVARGGTVLSSLMAAVILTLLVWQRHDFEASTDRSSVRAALPRLGLVALATLVAATLGIEASRRSHMPNVGVIFIACVERLFGQYNITLPDGVDDFVDPTLLTVGVSLVISSLYLLTRPVVDRRLSHPARGSERRIAELRAREIVRRHGRGTLDYFALRDDKQFFFFRDSLVAYAVYGGVALISPDPIGPEAERSEAFSAFRTYAEAQGWTISVMGAGEDWLPIYHAAGLHYLYTGDEAIVNCQTFSLEGGKMKGLRQACSRVARYGYTVEFLDPSTIAPSRVAQILELISMLRRGEGERGFSMMLGRLFDPKDKGLLLTVVTGPNGEPAAVCQFVPSPAINGYSLDLMRRDPGEHPNGLIDFALCSTIEHLRQQGARGLSLNFAAFRSVLDGERGDGTFTRVERWALKRLSGILPIESLWTFNAKYLPQWLPRYLVYPAAESFVPVVSAVLRAESLTEIPVIGRLLANDPSNRPGTVVPEAVLAAARSANDDPTHDAVAP